MTNIASKAKRMKEMNQWLVYSAGIDEMFDEIEAIRKILNRLRANAKHDSDVLNGVSSYQRSKTTYDSSLPVYKINDVLFDFRKSLERVACK